MPLVLLLRRTFSKIEDAVLREKNTYSAEFSKLLMRTLLCILKSPAGIVALAIICVGYIVNFYEVYSNKLPPTWFYTFPDIEQKNYYFSKHLTKLQTHITVFIIGLIGGHLCKSTYALYHLEQLKQSQNITRGKNKYEYEIDEHKSSNEIANNQIDFPKTNRTTQTKTPHSVHSKQSTTAQTKTSRHLSSTSSSISDVSSYTSKGQSNLQLDTSSTLSVINREFSANHRHLPNISSFVSLKILTSRNVISICLLCMSIIIFSTYKWSTEELPEPILSAVYDATSRLLWAVLFLVIILNLCLPERAKNSRGHTNSSEDNLSTYRRSSYSSRNDGTTIPASILSHPALIVLGRLSFLAYLISPYVQTFVLAVQEQPLFSSLFMMFHVIVGNIVITYSLAFALSVCIEQPIIRLMNKYAVRQQFTKQKFHVSTHCMNVSGNRCQKN